MQRAPGPAADIVETAADDDRLTRSPLLVLDRVRTFLDAHGLGSGDVRARRIGEGGGSNFTFLLERGSENFVLRRPPRPPLPPSAHDVVREARLQLALRDAGFTRLPTIAAVCEDERLLGVPFYVMTYLDGLVLTDDLPPGLETEAARRALGLDLVDSLVEIHAAEVETPALVAFARPGSYNERQVRRFAQPWEINKTRKIPEVEEVGARLTKSVPDPLPSTVVHGDFRLGNTMVARDDPMRILAVLDWRWARSAIRAPTSATCSRRTASRVARRIRWARRRSLRSQASRRAPSSSSATCAEQPRYRAASMVRGVGAVEGSGVLRGDLRALLCAASSLRRTSARRVSRKECRTSRRPQRLPSRERDQVALLGRPPSA